MDADHADRTRPTPDPARDGAHLPHGAISKIVIGAFFDVYNELGPGFLESVYQSAMGVALRARGLEIAREVSIDVRFRDEIVGTFRADLVVAGQLLIEAKAATRLVEAHAAQVVNYLKATGIPVGLLLNFGPRAEFRRLVLTRPIRVHPR